MNLNSLKNMDIKNLHLLAMPVKLVVAGLLLVVVLIFGYFIFLNDQLKNLETVRNKELSLKETYTQKSIIAGQFDSLKLELDAIQASFGTLLKQLPTTAEIPNIVQELYQVSAANGLRMDYLVPAALVNNGDIQLFPYEIAITGTYGQIIQFVRDIGALSRIVTLESLEIGTKDGLLTLSATAITYRVRSAEEIAADNKDKK